MVTGKSKSNARGELRIKKARAAFPAAPRVFSAPADVTAYIETSLSSVAFIVPIFNVWCFWFVSVRPGVPRKAHETNGNGERR